MANFLLKGHPTEIFEKKTQKQQQSMNIACWSHFKHFGRLLGKLYLFLTPSKTDGRVPSQQGAPTTCNLTYWEVSPVDVCQDITGQIGCGLRAKFKTSDLQFGQGRVFWFKSLRHSQLSFSQQHVPSKDVNVIFFVHISQPAKICLKNRCFEKQIHWVPLLLERRCKLW